MVRSSGAATAHGTRRLRPAKRALYVSGKNGGHPLSRRRDGAIHRAGRQAVHARHLQPLTLRIFGLWSESPPDRKLVAPARGLSVSLSAGPRFATLRRPGGRRGPPGGARHLGATCPSQLPGDGRDPGRNESPLKRADEQLREGWPTGPKRTGLKETKPRERGSAHKGSAAQGSAAEA